MINQESTTVIKAYTPQEITKVKDNEVFSKMNYLYQISQQIKTQSIELSNFYLKEFALNAQKKVIRVDKDISKDYCRKCLQYYEKNKFQIEKKGDKVFLLKQCTICKKIRKQFLSKKVKEQIRNDEIQIETDTGIEKKTEQNKISEDNIQQ